eukprot:Rmarinus@m.26198
MVRIGVYDQFGFSLPLFSAAVSIHVVDTLAKVSMTLLYQNTQNCTLDTSFIFPLEAGSIVSHFEAEVSGATVVRAPYKRISTTTSNCEQSPTTAEPVETPMQHTCTKPEICHRLNKRQGQEIAVSDCLRTRVARDAGVLFRVPAGQSAVRDSGSLLPPLERHGGHTMANLGIQGQDPKAGGSPKSGSRGSMCRRDNRAREVYRDPCLCNNGRAEGRIGRGTRKHTSQGVYSETGGRSEMPCAQKSCGCLIGGCRDLSKASYGCANNDSGRGCSGGLVRVCAPLLC